LAKLAGVSSGTVSNVISGSTKVSERSRQKVLDAIRILNYQPNLIARSLKTNRTRTLGIVIADITIPFFPKIIRGAECAAREQGYFLIVLDSEGSAPREADMIALLLAQRVEGILLVTAGGQDQSTERLVSLTSSSPVVCLDRLPVNLDVDSVCVDDCGAAEMTISHLMGMGKWIFDEVLGKERAVYGQQFVVSVARQLVQEYGQSLRRMMQFAEVFPKEEIVVSLIRQLSWTHFIA
jgi:DNA-binding LacI/PurR family transcriptional regulator